MHSGTSWMSHTRSGKRKFNTSSSSSRDTMLKAQRIPPLKKVRSHITFIYRRHAVHTFWGRDVWEVWDRCGQEKHRHRQVRGECRRKLTIFYTYTGFSRWLTVRNLQGAAAQCCNCWYDGEDEDGDYGRRKFEQEACDHCKSRRTLKDGESSSEVETCEKCGIAVDHGTTDTDKCAGNDVCWTFFTQAAYPWFSRWLTVRNLQASDQCCNCWYDGEDEDGDYGSKKFEQEACDHCKSRRMLKDGDSSSDEETCENCGIAVDHGTTDTDKCAGNADVSWPFFTHPTYPVFSSWLTVRNLPGIRPVL